MSRKTIKSIRQFNWQGRFWAATIISMLMFMGGLGSLSALAQQTPTPTATCVPGQTCATATSTPVCDPATGANCHTPTPTPRAICDPATGANCDTPTATPTCTPNGGVICPTETPTPMPTPTCTPNGGVICPTETPTPMPTPTCTPNGGVICPTETPTATPTPSCGATAPCDTPTVTPTCDPLKCPTATPTCVPGQTCPTETPTPMPTATCDPNSGVVCDTPTATPTPSCGATAPCDTPTVTPTCDPLKCPTATPTCVPGQTCATNTPTPMPTATCTPNSGVLCPTNTPQPTPTCDPLKPCTPTATPTCVPGQTCATETPTPTATCTTATGANCNTPTPMPTATCTPNTGVICPTNTPTPMPTATCDPTKPCDTPTATPTCTPNTGVICPTNTPTAMPTATCVPGKCDTPTITATPTLCTTPNCVTPTATSTPCTTANCVSPTPTSSISTPRPTPTPIKIKPGGVITGIIISLPNLPISHVYVSAIFSKTFGPRQTHDNWQGYYGWTQSDTTGHYTISHLIDGPFTVYFSDPNQQFIPQYYKNTRYYTSTTPVMVVSGTVVSNVNATLQPMPTPVITITSNGSSMQTNPDNGQVTIVSSSRKTDTVKISRQLTCPDGTFPNPVILFVSGQPFTMTHVGGGQYVVVINTPTDLPTIPSMPHQMELSYTCGNQVITEHIGEWHLYDPSGFVTDVKTGQPINQARVTLYRIPNALPDKNGQTNQCRTVDTRPVSSGGIYGAWSGLPAAELSLGQFVDPQADAALFEPQLNSQITAANGYYAWNVAEGCWFVYVQATGYHSLVSPLVGVPPEVTDLDIALTPLEKAKQSIYLPIIRK